MANPGTPGMLIQILYPNAQAYQIFDEDGNAIMHTDWSNEELTWIKPTGPQCGEFRFEGVINRLQFWINPGCVLTIRPRDAVMLAIRLEFPLSTFFDEGGVVTFTDRMAGVLGIHQADLKVV